MIRESHLAKPIMAGKRNSQTNTNIEAALSCIKRQKFEKGTENYQELRQRNNIAVKRSREKSREKAKNTVEKVKRLREENAELEQKVEILTKELALLKDMFLAHANSECNFEDGIEKYADLLERQQKLLQKIEK